MLHNNTHYFLTLRLFFLCHNYYRVYCKVQYIDICMQTPSWKNGWTETAARGYCENITLNNPARIGCQKYISMENSSEEAIEECVLDIRVIFRELVYSVYISIGNVPKLTNYIINRICIIHSRVEFSKIETQIPYYFRSMKRNNL